MAPPRADRFERGGVAASRLPALRQRSGSAARTSRRRYSARSAASARDISGREGIRHGHEFCSDPVFTGFWGAHRAKVTLPPRACQPCCREPCPPPAAAPKPKVFACRLPTGKAVPPLITEPDYRKRGLDDWNYVIVSTPTLPRRNPILPVYATCLLGPRQCGDRAKVSTD